MPMVPVKNIVSRFIESAIIPPHQLQQIPMKLNTGKKKIKQNVMVELNIINFDFDFAEIMERQFNNKFFT